MPASATIEGRPAEERGGTSGPAFGVYVHWPFCRAKCPYCDFNSHVRPMVDMAAWQGAFETAIGFWRQRTGRRTVTSLFFGGGTPSLMPPSLAAAIIDGVDRHWGFAPEAEITLEANPTSVEAGKFADFAAAGVNRVSLGIQALEDDALRFLGREHSVAEALAALAVAQGHFARVSIDLIYARPEQDVTSWRRELQRALALGTEHVSLYQLTIEPGTRFARAHAAGELAIPGDDAAAKLFEETQEITTAAGLPAYEISNHARPGAESRHNLLYWRYQDYAGIGPGAHGRLRLEGRLLAMREIRQPEAWLAAMTSKDDAIVEEAPVDASERAVEALMMGLRLSEGIDPDVFRRRTGRRLADAIDGDAREMLVAEGLLSPDSRRLTLTPHGRLLLNTVLAALVPA